MLFLHMGTECTLVSKYLKESPRFNEYLSFPKEKKQQHINSRLAASLFPKGPLTWTHYALPTPWASDITTFSLTYYYPLLTTSPMGFRYYHLQPYILLPPWASGITTFSLTNYYPLGLQVLPPSATQPVQTTVYPNLLYWCSLLFVQLWDSVLLFLYLFLQNRP